MKELQIKPEAKALIFDLDGTLADTMQVHFIAYRHVLKDFGIDLAPELFLSMAGVPAVETIAKLNEIFGTSMEPKETGFKKEREYEKIMHQMKPVEPVVELAKKYHGKLPMAVGTGGYKRLSWKTLEIIGMDKYFDVLVSSDDVTHPKPHPETFLKCAELLGVSPEFCQVFEDGMPGIEAAKAGGMMYTLITDIYPAKLSVEV